MLNENEIEYFIEAIKSDGYIFDDNNFIWSHPSERIHQLCKKNVRDRLLSLADYDGNRITDSTIFIRLYMYRIVANRKVVALENAEILDMGIATCASLLNGEG